MTQTGSRPITAKRHEGNAVRKTPGNTSSLRSAAESRIGKAPAPQARSAEELLHELQMHQIELVMQNETLHQAQSSLAHIQAEARGLS